MDILVFVLCQLSGRSEAEVNEVIGVMDFDPAVKPKDEVPDEEALRKIKVILSETLGIRSWIDQGGLGLREDVAHHDLLDGWNSRN